MAKKYNFSITVPTDVHLLEGGTVFATETLQVEGCDSFDEAIKIVEKVAKERKDRFIDQVLPSPTNAVSGMPNKEVEIAD